MYFVPVPVLAWYITGTEIKWCPYQYWHICTTVQYQYGYGKLPVLALNGASTGIGIYAFWSSTSIGTVHYWYWHLMVPVPVMAFMHLGSLPVSARYITGTVPVPVLAYLHFCPIPVLARYITGTAITWCPYQYWHFGTLVQYQYWHGPLPVLAFNGASTVLAYLHFVPIPVLARYFTGTGIKWCQHRYWHLCIYGPVPVLARYITGTGIK